MVLCSSHNDALVCEDWAEQNGVVAGVSVRVRCRTGVIVVKLICLSSLYAFFAYCCQNGHFNLCPTFVDTWHNSGKLFVMFCISEKISIFCAQYGLGFSMKREQHFFFFFSENLLITSSSVPLNSPLPGWLHVLWLGHTALFCVFTNHDGSAYALISYQVDWVLAMTQ